MGATVSAPLLLVSDTIIVLVAAWFKATVHVVDALLPSVEDAQTNDESCGETLAVALRVKVCETPFNIAVSTAV